MIENFNNLKSYNILQISFTLYVKYIECSKPDSRSYIYADNESILKLEGLQIKA